MDESNFNVLKVQCGKHVLSDFKYIVAKSSIDSHFKEIVCNYNFDNINLSLFIFFPAKLFKNNSIYIEKSREFISSIIENREIIRYSKRFLKYKTYSFKAPLPYGAIYIATNDKNNEKDDEFMKENENMHVNEKKKATLIERFKNSKRRTKAIVFTSLALLLCASVALPIYFTFFNKTVISNKIEDLLPDDQKEKQLILDSVNVSNTKVVLKEDFKTVISVKDEVKEDIIINNVRIFVLQEASADINEFNEKKKVELKKDSDYTFVNEKSKATIKVFGKAVTDKLTINIDFKDISFNRVVKFENKSVDYINDETTTKLEIAVNDGKQLPADYTINYKYNDTIQKTPFAFSQAGSYTVHVTLTANEYKTYEKDATLTINKIELNNEQKAKYSLTNLGPHKETEATAAAINSEPSAIPYTSSKIKYINKQTSVSSEEVPQLPGEYFAEATISFANYKNYTFKDTYIINEYDKHDLTLNFDSIKIKKATLSSAKAKYKSQITVTAEANEGYTLTNIKVTNKKTSEVSTYDFSSGVASFTMPDSNVAVEVNATINSYVLNLIAKDGGKIYQKGSTTTEVSSIDIEYKSKILKKINDNVEAKLDGAAFRGWSIDDGSTFINDETTMPASSKTATAFWNKYNFVFANGEHATVSDSTTHNDLIKLENASTVTVTANPGYTFNGSFDVFVDTSTTKTTTTDFTSPLAPGTFTTIPTHGTTITLKPVCSKNEHLVSFTCDTSIGESITNGDPFDLAYDELIQSTLTTKAVSASLDGAKFKCWNDGANDINDNSKMPDKNITLHPTWDSYTINISVVGGTTTTSKFEKKTILHEDEIKFTPNANYHFDHFEYKKADGSFATTTMPFKPYKLNNTLVDGDNVELKVVCVPDTVEVMLNANGGKFDTKESKTINVDYGTKWSDISEDTKASWGIPTSTTGTFIRWTLEPSTGAEIPGDTTFTAFTMLYAYYQ